MAFSGGVKLGDLDDFISLSQECVKPLIQAADGTNKSAQLQDISEAKALPVAEVPQVQKPNLIKSKQSSTDPKAQIGQVSLSDCLACSGCVTSAETVLLQEQSAEEFMKRSQAARLTVVSISPEARTSLAAYTKEDPLLTMRKAAEGLRRLGVEYVLDTSAAESVALLEGKAEFIQRYKASYGGSSSSSKGRLPLLTSHCPGWTVYAEKVVDPVILPQLCQLRPPQHVQGRLVKTCLLEAHNRRQLHRWWRARSPLFAMEGKALLCQAQTTKALSDPPTPVTAEEVYHVFVQPCYDRKIEAARPHFEVPDASGIKEVDTVLTATELLDLLREAGEGCCGGCGKSACEKTEPQKLPPVSIQSEVFTDLFLGHPQDTLSRAVRGNAGSGGFLEHIFREAAQELFAMEVSSSPLVLQTKQNEDLREVCLKDPKSQEVLLRFTAAYGFRNIQNVIRRVAKLNGTNGSFKDVGHFVEIMACPGGCLNGGGQIPDAKSEEQHEAKTQAARRQRLNGLEDVLLEGASYVTPAEHPLAQRIYEYIAAQVSCKGTNGSWQSLIGSDEIRSWLLANWKSLKVDSEGKDVVTSSVLKW